MTQVTVTVRTAEKISSSEDKFYRTFELPTCSLFQWGSQRNGRSGGQFKIAPSPSDALTQSNKKRSEGYIAIGQAETFTVDSNKLQAQVAKGHRDLGPFLDSLYAASAKTPASSGTSTPTTKPDPVAAPAGASNATLDTLDRIGSTNARALAAISLAAADPGKALTEYSLLQDEIDGLEADLRKIKSYMGTLEILVEEAL